MLNSGIYKITNIITRGIYLGRSVNLNKRHKTHFNLLRKNKHHSIKLQRSFNKHLETNFIFEVLEYCEIENLLDKERYYMQLLNPKYNIAKDPFSVMLGRKHKKSTLKKFKNRKIYSGKDNSRYGKKLSNEHKEKISVAQTGTKRSEETKKKMSDTAKRINSISRTDISKKRKSIIDNKGNTFKSLTDAAAFWDISVCTVCDILKGRHFFTRKKVSFSYA